MVPFARFAEQFAGRFLGAVQPDDTDESHHRATFGDRSGQLNWTTRTREVQDAVTIADVMPKRPSTCRLCIAVVDPNTAVRAGLPLMLSSFAFSATYANCADALADHPDADVMMLAANTCDGGLPGRRDLDNVAACVAAGYRVCIYTLDRRPHFLARCLRAGAHGVVLKSDPLDALVECLRRVARGGIAISRNAALPDPTADGVTIALTPRQQQVLAGRARGESFHRIARRLGISERTAHDHWSAIARRFSEFLMTHSPADLERSLGLDPGAAPLYVRCDVERV
jgi:two-component system nitrate/nitrite response regulator NarL